MARRTGFAAALLGVLIGLTGCTGGAPQGEEVTPTPIPTAIVPTSPTYVVQRGEVVDELQVSGRIAPVVEEELFFRVAGYVDVVYVRVDDQVKDGDVLAELETADLQNQLAQGQTDLQAAQLDNARQLAEARAGLQTAELRLAQAKVSDPGPQVTIAEADVERAQMVLGEVQEEYQKSLDRPWEPQDVRDAHAYEKRLAELDLIVAEALLEQAQQSRQVHYYDIQLLEQEVELANLRVEELEIGVELQRAQLAVKRLEDQLADAQIVAPFDGQVLAVNVRKGRSVEAHTRAIVVAQTDRLEVSTEIQDRSDLEKLAEGMPVAIELANRPGEVLSGHIRQLPYPYGGGGRTDDVREGDRFTHITFDTPADATGFEIGDLVRVTIVLERKEGVLWLPPQAIRTFEGRKFVVVQEGAGQMRVDVKIGIEAEDRVEIEEGLAEGQVVVAQ